VIELVHFEDLCLGRSMESSGKFATFKCKSAQMYILPWSTRINESYYLRLHEMTNADSSMFDTVKVKYFVKMSEFPALED